MTKSEFILSLSEALADLPGSERSRILTYFEEMIDDRIESGMTEEEAVSAIGSVDEILKEAAPEALNGAQRARTEVKQPQPGNKSIDFRCPIENLSIKSGSAKLRVLSTELPDGLTARVEYNLSENEECICSIENNTLNVQYNKLRNQGFSLRSLFSGIHSFITVTLSNPALVSGKIGSASGDVHLNGLVFTDSLEAGTASGEIKAQDIAVQCDCSLHAASGDIEARNLTCGDHLEMHTASGDMDLFDVRAGKIRIDAASGDPTLGSIECDELAVNCASGDVDMRGIRAGKIHAGAASGDITLSDATCTEIIEMNSASGDIEIHKSHCGGDIKLSSTNGDIDGSLQPAENYTFLARSRTGSVKVPRTNGACIVEINTNSGDISF